MIPRNLRRGSRRIADAMRSIEIATMLFLFAATPTQAAETEGPSIHDTVEYHDISGDTEEALASALKQLSYAHTTDDRFFSAYTHWRLRWNFRVESVDGSCHLSSAAIGLDVDMNLPRWKTPPGAAPELVKRWNVFAAALRKHEDGHREIAVTAAREVQTRAEKTPPERNCERLKKNLSRTADATLREFRDKENSYDVTTMHGRTQGATFP
jgi:predicted secreted Zn-dependent protease